VEGSPVVGSRDGSGLGRDQTVRAKRAGKRVGVAAAVVHDPGSAGRRILAADDVADVRMRSRGLVAVRKGVVAVHAEARVLVDGLVRKGTGTGPGGAGVDIWSSAAGSVSRPSPAKLTAELPSSAVALAFVSSPSAIVPPVVTSWCARRCPLSISGRAGTRDVRVAF
jgi:hypothetical protein